MERYLVVKGIVPNGGHFYHLCEEKVALISTGASRPYWRGCTRYSGTASPEPPNSLGKSLSFGSPSLIGRTVSE
jgi:hypothetical protein